MSRITALGCVLFQQVGKLIHCGAWSMAGLGISGA